MGENKITVSVEQQFREIVDIILQHKSRASKAVNKELLLTAWSIKNCCLPPGMWAVMFQPN